MISYEKFKEIFNIIDSKREPEMEFYFKNRKNTYMIIKYNDYVTFQRCGRFEEQSGEIKFKSLDELYNSHTIDNIVLKKEWNNIKDILFDCLSINRNKEDISEMYNIKI